MNKYYEEKQIIARVDRKGNIIGPIEKWEAHKKGILHKAFTVALHYKESLIIQHRKHPAFDGVLDITSSSHQVFKNGRLQDTINAVYETLKREWNLERKDLLKKPKISSSIYYKEKDSKSEFTEHEICEIVVCQIKKLPVANLDFAYGFSIAGKREIENKKGRLYESLAPWVKKAIEKKLL